MIDDEVMKTLGAYPLQGVRFNVVRRPLSGGKGTIVQKTATQGSKCPKCKGKPYLLDNDGNTIECPKCRGTGRINAKPAETKEAYYARVAQYIKDNPQDYFMRWNVAITPEDIVTFRRQCLDPILEQLCDWWAWVSTHNDPFQRGTTINGLFGIHWLTPFGIYNPLLEGNPSDMDSYLATGSTMGLQRVTNLFPEL